jgi:hypothetical protein
MQVSSEKEEQKFSLYKQRIKEFDRNPDTSQRTFEGGCDFLLDWYCSIVSEDTTI